MTANVSSTIKSLLKRDFDPNETLKLLTYGQNKFIFWSWGANSQTNVDNKALLFKVNGHHHKGFVLITLDWNDTYIVNIINTRGRILNTYNGVYVDQLMEVIDNRVEKIKDYQF